jgi:hypothetical protein
MLNFFIYFIFIKNLHGNNNARLLNNFIGVLLFSRFDQLFIVSLK